MERDLERDRFLVDQLTALSNLNRVLILRALRVPRALVEIEVRDDGMGQPLARQSVRRHLDTLLASDLVRAFDGTRDYGETTEFVVNHQRIFSLSEDLRALARLRPMKEHHVQTEPARPAARQASRGPCLVLTNGLEEGAMFSLAPGSARKEWIVGRRRGADVPLDFDASISSENTLVRWLDDGHYVEDLPGSRNGTRLNFARIEPGAVHKLAHGDIIGVGRCLLVYWT